MGTWGSGNLESDGALDAMGGRSDELIARVWDTLQSKTSTEADEWEYDQLFLDIEWLLALENAGVFSGWGLPPVAEFDRVVDEWMPAWADYFDGLAGPEFKAERGAVIEGTFARVRDVCAKYEALRG